MIKFRISKFLNSEKFELALDDFEPGEGYELFLKRLCEYLGEHLISWKPSSYFGLGCMTYRGYKLKVCQSDLPFAFNFDCRDRPMAEELQIALDIFFAQRFVAADYGGKLAVQSANETKPEYVPDGKTRDVLTREQGKS